MAIEALSHAIYFEEEVSEDDISKLRALNLLEMLETEFEQDVWDFGKIKAIFRALRLVPDPNSIEFVVEKFELFLPFMKDLVLYLDELDRAHTIDFSALREKVLIQIGAVRANMTRPLEKLFCDWVKTKHANLVEVLEARSDLAKD